MNKTLKIFFMCFSIVILLVRCGKKEEERTAAEETKKEVTSGAINVDGFELSYFIEGTGVPVVVLEGILYPDFFSKELKRHVKFIYADTRFLIPTETPEVIITYTMDTFIDDIEQIRGTLGFDKIAVLGHSRIGFLPLEYAKKYPENTSHAIVIGTPPYFNTEKYDKAVAEFWDTDASQERKAILKSNQEKLNEDTLSSVSPAEAFIMAYVADAPKFFLDPLYDASWAMQRLINRDFSMDVANHYSTVVLKNYDITNIYSQIKTPVFIAVGRYDYWAPYFLWDEVKDLLPNHSFNLFEKSSHFPMFEEQELFDKKLIEWIKSH